MATAFGYTPNEIADMTPFQQLSLYSPEAVSERLFFKTHEEYAKWAMTQQSRSA